MRRLGRCVLLTLLVASLPAPVGSEEAAFVISGRVQPPGGSSLEQGILTIRGRRQPDNLPLGMPNWAKEGTDIPVSADGRFRIDSQKRGPYVIDAIAWADGALCAAQHIVRPEQADAAVLKLEPVPPGGVGNAVLIRVLDSAGRLVPKVDIEVISRGRNSHHRIFRRGWPGLSVVRYEQPVTKTLVHVARARGSDGTSLPLGSAVAEGSVQGGVTVRLAAPRSLAGVVRSTSGKPLKGVELSAFPDVLGRLRESYGLGLPGDYYALACDAEATSDAEGRFSLEGLGAGRYVIEVQESPKDHVPPAPHAVSANATSIDIQITAKVRPILTVLDASGTPIEGALVQVVRQNGRVDGGLQQRLRTDVAGRATSAPLDPSQRFFVRVDASQKGLLPWEQDVWTPQDQELRLKKGHAIAGTVRRADGSACADASVYLRTAPDSGTSLPPDWGWIRIAGGFVQGALSGADGSFRIARLPAGAYEIQAIYVDDAAGHTARSTLVRAEAGSAPLELTLVR